MTLNLDEQKYLIKIINAGLFENDLTKALNLVLRPRKTTNYLPDKIQGLLENFCVHPQREILINLSLLLTEQFYLSTEYQLDVVARLFAQNHIAIQKAFDLLSPDAAATTNLSTTHQRCIDILWHLKEDAKDGFMSFDEDNVFINSLNEISKHQLVVA